MINFVSETDLPCFSKGRHVVLRDGYPKVAVPALIISEIAGHPLITFNTLSMTPPVPDPVTYEFGSDSTDKKIPIKNSQIIEK
jgi:hypothetical protein